VKPWLVFVASFLAIFVLCYGLPALCFYFYFDLSWQNARVLLKIAVLGQPILMHVLAFLCAGLAAFAIAKGPKNN
jgi:hypothetical protein